MITITQSIFETHVHAFRDVESRTFDAITPTLQRVLENTYEHLSTKRGKQIDERRNVRCLIKSLEEIKHINWAGVAFFCFFSCKCYKFFEVLYIK